MSIIGSNNFNPRDNLDMYPHYQSRLRQRLVSYNEDRDVLVVDEDVVKADGVEIPEGDSVVIISKEKFSALDDMQEGTRDWEDYFRQKVSKVFQDYQREIRDAATDEERFQINRRKFFELEKLDHLTSYEYSEEGPSFKYEIWEKESEQLLEDNPPDECPIPSHFLCMRPFCWRESALKELPFIPHETLLQKERLLQGRMDELSAQLQALSQEIEDTPLPKKTYLHFLLNKLLIESYSRAFALFYVKLSINFVGEKKINSSRLLS